MTAIQTQWVNNSGAICHGGWLTIHHVWLVAVNNSLCLEIKIYVRVIWKGTSETYSPAESCVVIINKDISNILLLKKIIFYIFNHSLFNGIVGDNHKSIHVWV